MATLFGGLAVNTPMNIMTGVLWQHTSMKLSNLDNALVTLALEPEMALEACTDGMPLTGNFECSLNDVLHHEIYDNHEPTHMFSPNIHRKFGDEEANSYHIVFPCFVVYFIYGLFLTPISWVIQKGKGWIIINPSTHLSPSNTGAANDYIPPTGQVNREWENLAMYYGTAFTHHLKAIWNL